MKQNETDLPAQEIPYPQGKDVARRFEQDTRNLLQGLTERQLSVLPHLLKPGTITSKARNANVSRATLYRWLEDDTFRSSLQMLRQATFEIAQSELHALSYDAAAALRKALESDNLHLNVQAARIILGHGLDAQHSYQVKQRVDTLEEAAGLSEFTAPPW